MIVVTLRSIRRFMEWCETIRTRENLSLWNGLWKSLEVTWKHIIARGFEIHDKRHTSTLKKDIIR
jgi:hypothetical protein